MPRLRRDSIRVTDLQQGPSMPISPHLLRKLQEALGAEAASDLASRLDDMDANRGDIGELRHEMQLGFARMDAQFVQVRSDLVKLVESGQAKMELLLEKGLREQTRFFFLAWAVLLATVIGLSRH